MIVFIMSLCYHNKLSLEYSVLCECNCFPNEQKFTSFFNSHCKHNNIAVQNLVLVGPHMRLVFVVLTIN